MFRATFVLAGLAPLLVGASPAAAQSTPLNVVWAQEASEATQLGARALAFSPDGAYVATGGTQGLVGGHTVGRVDLFAAADGAPLARRETHGDTLGATNTVAFSADGTVLVSGHGDRHCDPGCGPDRTGLFTWSVPDLAPLVAVDVPETDQPMGAAFSPGGARLAVASAGGDGGGGSSRLLRVYDATTLAPEHELYGDPYAALGVAFSPDGQALASTGTGGYLRLWDVPTGALLHITQHGQRHTDGIPASVAFSPDGQRIATGGIGSDVHVKVWRASDLGLVLDLEALEGGGAGDAEVVVATSPNGAYLVGGGVRGADGVSVIRFWDAATGAVVVDYLGDGTGGLAALAFSAGQDHHFAYLSGGVVRVAQTPLHLVEAVTTAGEAGPAAGEAFRLAPAGANPSAAPALALTVAREQHVRADVYDALGRRVAVLFDRTAAAGVPVRLALDGQAPGAYVVRVVGAEFTAARLLTRTP